MHDSGRAAAIRAQLAAAKVQCEYPSCSAQATGVRTVGKTAPYLCDDHLADPSALAVVERMLRDAEHRGRYPNGLTLEEYLGLNTD